MGRAGGGVGPGFGLGNNDYWHFLVLFVDGPHAAAIPAGAALVGAGGGRVLNDPVAVVGFGFLVEAVGGAVFVSCKVGKTFAVETLFLAM